ncbi:ComE operon protein 1 [Mycobacteroides abscessus subsp. massiliense]|nr:ComE operon protein 1 [Mycobacteroides abscessus subsp. massiliense]
MSIQKDNTKETKIFIDIKGAVKHPNVYEMSSSNRVIDALGIGPSKAKDILNYREKNNGFNSINDLMKIKGFGKKTFEKLKEHFTI